MLVSFQLASKHPDSLIALFDNLESLASDPSCFEVLVKADIEDPRTQDVLFAQIDKRIFKLRPHITPRRRGYEDLWIALNELFYVTDPLAYFVCNINDEIRIRQRGWDTRLRRYIGLFPDHIFRLRTSKLKFRNYYDFWECGFAPENYAFFTKRWLDICGDWNPCFGPDSSQQYIAYYLGYGNYPGAKQYNRDVPILDISWANEGVGLNLSQAEQQRRTSTNFRLWQRQISHPMQQELYRRARLLQAHIMQHENSDNYKIGFFDDKKRKMIVLRDQQDGVMLDALPYKLNRSMLFIRNIYRTAHYTYYAGGGREAHNLLPISLLEFLNYRYIHLRKFWRLTSPRFAVRRVASRIQKFSRKLNLSRSSAWVNRAGSWTIQRLQVTGNHRRVHQIREHWNKISRMTIAGQAVSPITRVPLPFSLIDRANNTAKVTDVISECRCRGSPPQPKGLTVGAALSRVFHFLLWPIFRPFAALAMLTFRASRSFAKIARSALASVAAQVTRGGVVFDISFSAWRWRVWGRRLALTLRDRDTIWFSIKDEHRARIAISRNPWHERVHPTEFTTASREDGPNHVKTAPIVLDEVRNALDRI